MFIVKTLLLFFRESLVDYQLWQCERLWIEDQDNSKVREDLSDIQGVWKQPPKIGAVIRMAHWDIFCLRTK